MATKHPIILVHGIMLKDILHFRAFGKIETVLKKSGYITYTSNHDGLGTIENNAHQLADFIKNVLDKEKASKVNIIAHSKGGLDALYMVDRLDFSEQIASITFLCTPHKGSIIATKLYSLPKIVRGFIAFWLNFWYKIFGDKKPDALTVCKQLSNTSDNIIECFQPHDGIYMQSYSSRMERCRDDFIMGIPLMISRRYQNDASDGLVSAESSKFKEYKGDCLGESISHSEIVDFMVKKHKKAKIYAFYVDLCKDLESRGL